MADRFLVGRGISDITGEPSGVGMLGYGKAGQRTAGIHTRLRSRAFVFDDDGSAVLLLVNDLPLVFESVHREVLRRLAARFGDRYTERNVMITATHTHCGPGGYSGHLLYNTATGGFRPKTFEAVVRGMVEAAHRAHDDLAPSSLSLAHGELRDASVNRSRAAFDRNPAADRAHFPDANDPRTTLLRIHRAGRLVGAVNWFATHNTPPIPHPDAIGCATTATPRPTVPRWRSAAPHRPSRSPRGADPRAGTGARSPRPGDLTADGRVHDRRRFPLPGPVRGPFRSREHT